MAIYQDDTLVKRAFTKVRYTKAKYDELAACYDPVTGPAYFIENFMYIQHSIRGREKIKLYDFQYDLIDNYHGHRKSVNMVSRQMGKCLFQDVGIKVKNKKTGEERNLTLAEFERIIKN